MEETSRQGWNENLVLIKGLRASETRECTIVCLAPRTYQVVVLRTGPLCDDYCCDSLPRALAPPAETIMKPRQSQAADRLRLERRRAGCANPDL